MAEIVGSTTTTPLNPDVFLSGLGNAWEKIVDVTTETEKNDIMATVEEYPNLADCKEFVFRIVFPKSPTSENLTLGASRIFFNTDNQIIFRFASTTVSGSAICEHRCHCVIADNLIQSTGTNQPIGQSVVTGSMQMLVGNWVAPSVINNIRYCLNEANELFPVGTRFVIYGKKGDIGKSENTSGGSITVDQTFNPLSENAQSGKAVSEALMPIYNDLNDFEMKYVTHTRLELEYVSKNELDVAFDEKLGDIETALVELHNYAQALINGGAE